MAESTPYNPTSEPTNAEQVIAAHWEGLHRNRVFQEVARNWVKSDTFRRKHALSSDYHNPQVHFPRCALDWMITPEERVRLSRFQRKNRLWFCDHRFNFGPITIRQNFHLSRGSQQNLKDLVTVEAMGDTLNPLRIEDTWDLAPSVFKNQFALACHQEGNLHETTLQLKEAGTFLRWIAARIIRQDLPHEPQKSAQQLWDLGQWLLDEAEFHRVFHIPKSNYSRKAFDQILQRIKKEFAVEFRIDPETKYNRHSSYFGTPEDWKWFLEAERRNPNDPLGADLYELARAYSTDLRDDGGRHRKNVKQHGVNVPSALLKNRRQTLIRHIKSIQKWIARTYPPPPLPEK